MKRWYLLLVTETCELFLDFSAAALLTCSFIVGGPEWSRVCVHDWNRVLRWRSFTSLSQDGLCCNLYRARPRSTSVPPLVHMTAAIFLAHNRCTGDCRPAVITVYHLLAMMMPLDATAHRWTSVRVYLIFWTQGSRRWVVVQMTRGSKHVQYASHQSLLVMSQGEWGVLPVCNPSGLFRYARSKWDEEKRACSDNNIYAGNTHPKITAVPGGSN